MGDSEKLEREKVGIIFTIAESGDRFFDIIGAPSIIMIADSGP